MRRSTTQRSSGPRRSPPEAGVERPSGPRPRSPHTSHRRDDGSRPSPPPEQTANRRHRQRRPGAAARPALGGGASVGIWASAAMNVGWVGDPASGGGVLTGVGVGDRAVRVDDRASRPGLCRGPSWCRRRRPRWRCGRPRRIFGVAGGAGRHAFVPFRGVAVGRCFLGGALRGVDRGAMRGDGVVPDVTVRGAFALGQPPIAQTSRRHYERWPTGTGWSHPSPAQAPRHRCHGAEAASARPEPRPAVRSRTPRLPAWRPGRPAAGHRTAERPPWQRSGVPRPGRAPGAQREAPALDAAVLGHRRGRPHLRERPAVGGTGPVRPVAVIGSRRRTRRPHRQRERRKRERPPVALIADWPATGRRGPCPRTTGGRRRSPPPSGATSR